MKGYTIRLDKYNSVGQDIQVTDAEDGGLEINLKDAEREFKLFLQKNEIDDLIDMLKKGKEYLE